MESGKLFKMPFYDNNTYYIIIFKYYFDGRWTGLVSALKILIFKNTLFRSQIELYKVFPLSHLHIVTKYYKL
jgi:hypothetical protein